MFDDYNCLVKNPAIKNFDCFPDTRKAFEFAIDQDIKNNIVLRPAAYFTFAVNYALHGLDLFGYHLVNLLLHLGCGMLMYYFFVQLMLTPEIRDEEINRAVTSTDDASYLPLFAALLFVCHPIQTQAVTYIVQRFVPLATFFYLAALVLYLEFRRTSKPMSRVWMYLFSLTAAVLAMESKEIAFTLPVIIALVEFLFFQGHIVSRLGMLAPFILTMAIIPAKLMHLSSPVSPDKIETTSSAINLVNFGGISSSDYLMTQFGVIVTYIRLLFLPIGQNFDYDYPLQQSFFKPEVLFPLALLLMLIGSGFYLLTRSDENRLYKIIAFGIFWFFITLSVESSIAPIADLIFEHRAYLPSVGFFISILAAASVICNRVTGKSITQTKIARFLLFSLIAGLSATAIARNSLWQNDTAFWKDVVKKSPNKARVHRWMGSTLLQQSKQVPDDKDILENLVFLKAGSEKQIHAAIIEFKEAIRLEPQNPVGHYLLAEALILQKNYDEALRSLSTASALQPTNPIQFAMRGEIFERNNNMARARQEYLEAIKIDPSNHVAHVKLANIYAKEDNNQAAIKELESVLRIYPDEAVREKLERLKTGSHP
jgi:tetratricopeptide (TPR) repeat protein